MRRRPRPGGLAGHVVVITGAASGIGRALAREAAARGATVAVSDIDDDGLVATARSIHDAVPDARVDLSRLDVSDEAAVLAYADRTRAEHGRVDMLVNNAGVSLVGGVTDLRTEDIGWIVAVNLWGVIHGTRAFLPLLVASGTPAKPARLVNLSSLFGLIAVPGQSAYCATKYAVRGFTEAVREEMLLARHPVRVTCVHPGGVRTRIVRSGRAGADTDLASTADHFETRLARLTPERAARLIIAGALAGKPRVLVGADAHLVHQAARFSGARYQEVVAAVARRRRHEGP
ncbi:MAG: SDR family NAD(P)-dependent oxidoreductase [Nocardioides sp.]